MFTESLRLVIDPRYIERRPAEPQRAGLLAQEIDAKARALRRRVVLHSRINLVVPHAAENACVGAQPGKLLQAGVQWIAAHRDQVACDHRQVGTKVLRFIDHPRQFPLIQERPQVDIAQLQYA